MLICMANMATNSHFGHSGKSEVSENGPIGFPMAQNLGIDTKIKALACSEPKLQIWPLKLILSGQNGHQMAILAIEVNLRCLEMVPSDFPCPKT